MVDLIESDGIRRQNVLLFCQIRMTSSKVTLLNREICMFGKPKKEWFLHSFFWNLCEFFTCKLIREKCFEIREFWLAWPVGTLCMLTFVQKPTHSSQAVCWACTSYKERNLLRFCGLRTLCGFLISNSITSVLFSRFYIGLHKCSVHLDSCLSCLGRPCFRKRDFCRPLVYPLLLLVPPAPLPVKVTSLRCYPPPPSDLSTTNAGTVVFTESLTWGVRMLSCDESGGRCRGLGHIHSKHEFATFFQIVQVNRGVFGGKAPPIEQFGSVENWP